ncbi:phosphoadenylyl-sulfate reductase [Roseovarius sp. SCSIO 43702]|uniref:phosphoadenylyl-sulfate reductase n=1 Tax=Roseovarius sp. SCSIO 43702 TaxID=2823043 RepID=UPI001C73A5C9|nr:phosphoadenylyl-sulfate reductase [Roseovarius sp. SCSIO 43702]QYX55339.1 phosphoadenylyl-sulfate reductase [Roseovarius sp. SCSIO 43702]
MPPSDDLPARVGGLNDWYRLNSATSVLRHALTSPETGRLALVSSFGAEAVVLLHMVSVIDRTTPVIFLDTELLFAETLVYQQEVAERLGLRDVRIVRADRAEVARTDPEQTLHRHDTDACCALRKTRPLARALDGFDGWITGRKRYHGGARAALDFFETEEGTGRMKINPLAFWRREDMQTYMEENRLPRHPLVARGYPSIGCMPCTTPISSPDEDPRAGRWRNTEKTECGIHLVDGKLVRTGESA